MRLNTPGMWAIVVMTAGFVVWLIYGFVWGCGFHMSCP